MIMRRTGMPRSSVGQQIALVRTTLYQLPQIALRMLEISSPALPLHMLSVICTQNTHGKLRLEEEKENAKDWEATQWVQKPDIWAPLCPGPAASLSLLPCNPARAAITTCSPTYPVLKFGSQDPTSCWRSPPPISWAQSTLASASVPKLRLMEEPPHFWATSGPLPSLF